MRVGVIVPVHGWAPYLAEALDSVRAEEPAEVVVVDDGSPEPVPEATVRRPRRGGPAAARATGLEALSPACDLVALCDADDAWRPGRLRAQLAALGEFDVAVGRAVVVGPDGRPTGERWQELPRGEVVPPFDRNPICTSSVLLRRAALEAAGGFDSPLQRAEDWDLWLRLRASGARFVSVPEAVVSYRRRAGGLTADVAALARAQLELHARHAGLVADEERRRVEAADRRALAATLLDADIADATRAGRALATEFLRADVPRMARLGPPPFARQPRRQRAQVRRPHPAPLLLVHEPRVPLVDRELRAGQRRDVRRQRARAAPVRDDRLRDAHEARAGGPQPQPQVPVLGPVEVRREAARGLQRGPSQQHARRADRVAVVGRRELARRDLLPPLAGRPPVRPDDDRAPDGDVEVRQRVELHPHAPGPPRVVGVAQRDRVALRRQRREAGRPRGRGPAAARPP
ncbi:MAG TPA: glycosyltransferase, partial [Solirubrobacteraceae bacterium]|nr:glycosyltransferase [Solirubrobacteraceae bacterium]